MSGEDLKRGQEAYGKELKNAFKQVDSYSEKGAKVLIFQDGLKYQVSINGTMHGRLVDSLHEAYLLAEALVG